ncbi:MAG: NnrS family protein [Roseateles sp.]
MSPIQIHEPRATVARRFALFDLGFRPFYLLASVFAAISIPLWALQFSGLLPHPYLAGPVWHAHEMVFGFTLAVIVGFLFTAGKNWSNMPTPTGLPLACLCALWVASRVLVLTPYAWAAAVCNVAFPAAAAVALAIPFWKSGARRNYFFVGLLILVAGAAAAVHWSQLRGAASFSARGIQLALDVVLFILAVMGGRVIPMFTNNGVPGADATKRPGTERTALGLVLAVLVADQVGLGGLPAAVLLAIASLAHSVRWLLWRPWTSRKTPLVWVLHLAYLWVPIHLLLRAAAAIGLVTPSLSAHALTVGAIGGLIIGMMTRTSRGHTARPLVADRFDTACYVLVALAALVRVALPLMAPTQLMNAVVLSAVLWSAGFGLFAIRYWPILCRPRLDGRPG